MIDIVTFDFRDNHVRTAGTSEAPLFCAADVCAALGIENASQACGKLDQDETELVYVGHSSGRKHAVFVTESGLYSLILTSRKPESREFKRWVTSEVLPALRKTGQYSVKPMSQAELIAASANLLVSIERSQAEHERRLAAIEADKLRAEEEARAVGALPEPPVEASERSFGQMTVALVNSFAANHGGAYQTTYRALYQAIEERPETRIDLRARLENAKKRRERGQKPTRLSDVIDSTGKAPEIYAIARQLFARAA